jgi:hypothetical protein
MQQSPGCSKSLKSNPVHSNFLEDFGEQPESGFGTASSSTSAIMRSLPSLPVALVSLLLSLCTHSVEASTKAIPAVFENSEVIRTIELGGSTSYVSTAIVASALEDNVSKYTVTLSEEEYSVTSWFQARLKGASEELPVQILPATPSRFV